MTRRLTAVTLLLPVLLAPGCNRGSTQLLRLTGGGSSLVNPIMTKWVGVCHREKRADVDYASSGSSNGIQQMIDGKNDFGCTDAPMNAEQLAKARQAKGDVVHIPIIMGGVVPAYNLAGLDEPLRFTGPLLADIFLGKIKKWNDPALQQVNPGVKLPSMDIAVVHRSDGSGTTYVFVDYLSKVSPEWKEKVGVGTDVKWPVGIGAQKTDGVASQVQRTPGGLGYIELAYALSGNIPYGAVQNAEGEFVRADLDSLTKAAAGAAASVPDDLRYSLTNAPGKGAYPICATVWAICYVKQTPEKAAALRAFLQWITHEGQNLAKDLSYAPLPEALIKRVEKKLDVLGDTR